MIRGNSHKSPPSWTFDIVNRAVKSDDHDDRSVHAVNTLVAVGPGQGMYRTQLVNQKHVSPLWRSGKAALHQQNSSELHVGAAP